MGADEVHNYLLRCITNTSRGNLGVNKSPLLYCNQCAWKCNGTEHYLSGEIETGSSLSSDLQVPAESSLDALFNLLVWF